MLNAIKKATFILFCYFFEKIVSEYLHVTSQRNVLNHIFIIGIFLFLSIIVSFLQSKINQNPYDPTLNSFFFSKSVQLIKLIFGLKNEKFELKNF